MSENLDSDEANDTQEAPEEAGGSAPRKRSVGPHTIQSLRLNVEEAEGGRTWLLLPPDVRRDKYKARSVPVLTQIGELARVADIKLAPRVSNAGAQYIRKCRAAKKRRAVNTRLADIEVGRAECEEMSAQTATVAAKAQAAMEAEVERVRLQAAKTLVSMADLNGLAKGAATDILLAFREGRTVNGEPITVDQAISAFGRVFSQVGKLGAGALDGAGKEQAEDEIMREFAEATRLRLAREGGDGSVN